MELKSRSKMISAALKVADILEDPFFFSIPGEVTDPNAVREVILKKYYTDSGILESVVDRDMITLQWYPDRIDHDAEKLNQEAKQLLKNKEIDQAISKWQNAIALYEDVEYLFRLALVYFEKKNYMDSIRYLEKAVEICPIHYKAHLLLGINWAKLRKLQEAEKYVMHSYRLNRSSVQSVLNLGVLFSNQKRYDEAVKMFTLAIELSPRESRAYLGLARIYSLTGEIEASNTNFKKVIELAPGTQMAEYAKRSLVIKQEAQSDANTQNNREEQISEGMGLYLSGQYREASAHYKKYLMTHTRDDYGWYLMGETKIRTGELEEASSCFKQAIKYNSKRGLYYKGLGIALHFQGKSKESIEVLKKAIEFGKKDALCQTLQGINALRIRKLDDASKNLGMTLKSHFNNPLALYHLALTHIQMEENDKATELLEKMLELNLLDSIRVKAQNLLKNINISL